MIKPKPNWRLRNQIVVLTQQMILQVYRMEGPSEGDNFVRSWKKAFLTELKEVLKRHLS